MAMMEMYIFILTILAHLKIYKHLLIKYSIKISYYLVRIPLGVSLRYILSIVLRTIESGDLSLHIYKY